MEWAPSVGGATPSSPQNGASGMRTPGRNSAGPSAEAGDAQGRLGEVLRQQPEAGDARGPAPVRRLEVEQLDLQRVAGLGTLDRDRPVDLVDPREVEGRQVLDASSPGDLAARGIEGVDLHHLAAADGRDRLDRTVPGQVELVATDVDRCGWRAHGAMVPLELLPDRWTIHERGDHLASPNGPASGERMSRSRITRSASFPTSSVPVSGVEVVDERGAGGEGRQRLVEREPLVREGTARTSRSLARFGAPPPPSPGADSALETVQSLPPARRAPRGRRLPNGNCHAPAPCPSTGIRRSRIWSPRHGPQRLHVGHHLQPTRSGRCRPDGSSSMWAMWCRPTSAVRRAAPPRRFQRLPHGPVADGVEVTREAPPVELDHRLPQQLGLDERAAPLVGGDPSAS